MQRFNQIHLFLLLLVTLICTHPTQLIKPRTFSYRKIMSGFKVDGNISSTFNDVSLQECVSLSAKSTSRAINYLKTKEDSGTCQVLSVDRDDAATVVATGYTYYELETVDPDPCTSNPCLHTGVCKPVNTPNGPDFACNCPYPLGGKTCADLICQSCQRKDDLVLFWNTTVTTTWIQSYEYCRNLGMNMFLDKNKAKHDFFYGIAKTVFPNVSTQVCFWIGLNRTTSIASWKYTDGTPLNSTYTSWSPNRPGGSTCVEVANGVTFDWKWDDEDCNAAGTWRYFPLCEKTYPFLLL